MRHLSPYSLGCSILGLLLAGGVAAAPISFVSSEVDLQVAAEATRFDPPPVVSDSDSDGINVFDVVTFDDSVTTSAQVLDPPTSSFAQSSLTAGVTGMSITLDGTAFSTSSDAGPVSSSDSSSSVDYELVFSVGSAIDYVFDIELIADVPWIGSAFSRVALSDAGGTIFDVSWTPFSGEYLGVFQEVGSLGPGTYTLVAEATSSSAEGGAMGDFSLTANFVPEPTTAALLALGLAALAHQRRPD